MKIEEELREMKSNIERVLKQIEEEQEKRKKRKGG